MGKSLVASNSKRMKDLLKLGSVLPVVTVSRKEDALPVARALVKGGVKTIEITLRTPCALPAIKDILEAMPQLIVGGGTVTSVRQLEELAHLGAHFAVSPGLTLDLLRQAKNLDIPYLPGVSSVSELMLGLSEGYDLFKFFPAAASGGINTLRSLAGPFSNVKFCPTGGIDDGNFRQYLDLANVISVGGSWLAPADLIRDQNWDMISSLARSAVSAGGS